MRIDYRVLLLIALVCCNLVGADDDLTVLSATADGVAPGRQLEFHLKQQFYRSLDERRQALDDVKSRDDCRKWQVERRQFFVRQIGGFPERTPLNAQLVGKLNGDGYRIEKILFESRPNHHVTANLYLPVTKGPYPGVLIPCGHSHNGKAAGGYQRMSILLARHGMAALCYDPIGQGERYQSLDFEQEHKTFTNVPRLAVPHPRVRFVCTVEHTLMGLGSILIGSNVAQYRIWDGMRAIDYLQTRDDIIADKIGCAGNSGGGTLTAYLMALDDRIVAAAPVCYLTTFRKLIDTRGAQDAEQNIFGQIEFGMDEPDYVMMRAPKPTLICAGTRDVTFDIDGTWDLFRQSKKFYARLGFPERVDLNEADVLHGMFLQQREAVARWMHRWLLGTEKVIHEVDRRTLPDPISDPQLRELSEGDWTQEQLYCTPDGQVLLMPGERSVFQINVEREQKLRKQRALAWNQQTIEERQQTVRQTIRLPTESGSRPELKPVDSSPIQRANYLIEKLILSPEPGIHLPALGFIPRKPNGQACLYLHGQSMTADAAPGGPIEALVGQGQVVIAAELRGIGETETGHHKRDYGRGRFGRDVQEVFLAYLLGRSYVGMRTGDVLAWTQFLRQYHASGDQPNQIHLVGIGEAAIPALHAAALEPSRFESVRLQQMIRSWSEIVSATVSQDQLVNTVHGALRRYDLPDLVDLAGSEKISIEQRVNVLGEQR